MSGIDSFDFLSGSKIIRKWQKEEKEELYKNYTREKCIEELREHLKTRGYDQGFMLCIENSKKQHEVVEGNAIVMAMYLKQYDLLDEIKNSRRCSEFTRSLSRPLDFLSIQGEKVGELSFEYLLWTDIQMPADIKMWLIDQVQINARPREPHWYITPGSFKNVNRWKAGIGECVISNVEAAVPYYKSKNELYERVNFAWFALRKTTEFLSLYQYFAKHLNEDENVDFFAQQINIFMASASSRTLTEIHDFLMEKKDLIIKSQWYPGILQLLYNMQKDKKNPLATDLCVELCRGNNKSFYQLVRTFIYETLDPDDLLLPLELIAAAADWYQKHMKKKPVLYLCAYTQDLALDLVEYIFFRYDEKCKKRTTSLFQLPRKSYINTNNLRQYFIQKIDFVGINEFIKQHMEKIFQEEDVELLVELVKQDCLDLDGSKQLMWFITEHNFTRSIPIMIQYCHNKQAQIEDEKAQAEEATIKIFARLDEYMRKKGEQNGTPDRRDEVSHS